MLKHGRPIETTRHYCRLLQTAAAAQAIAVHRHVAELPSFRSCSSHGAARTRTRTHAQTREFSSFLFVIIMKNNAGTLVMVQHVFFFASQAPCLGFGSNGNK